MTKEELNELNRKRSTDFIPNREGQTQRFDPVVHWQRLENAYQADTDPIEGQQAFPGFEEGKKKEPAPLNAETIKRNIAQVSFAVEYLKDPEGALVTWSAPDEVINHYFKQHYLELVQIAAEEMLADPRQIADRESRTPEQMQKLNEVAARESIARFNHFFKTRWYHALSALDGVEAQFVPPPEKDSNRPLSSGFLPIGAQAALYFFAVHADIDPTEAAELTEDQKQELLDIFSEVDAYYCDYERLTTTQIKADNWPGLLNAFVDFKHGPQKSKFAKAEDSGAIMSIGGRLYVPTDPEFQHAFSTTTRSGIGFFRRESETGARQLATDVSAAFMQALAKTVLIDIINEKKGDTEVYFPAFARELGLDINSKTTPRKGSGAQDVQELTTSRADARARFINKKLAEWDNIWGVLPNSNKEYKLMALHTYDPDKEVFTFQSPYLKELFARQLEKEEMKLRDPKTHYYLWQSDLLHATAASERNPAAVEMATRILQGVQQRGLTPDAKLKQNRGRAFKDDAAVTFTITCSRLVQDCPQIREKLHQLPDANQKTKLLKRAFPAMYKILSSKSDLFRYYKDLTITEVIPTAKSLGAVITISHHGANPDYQKPFLPIKETSPEEC